MPILLTIFPGEGGYVLTISQPWGRNTSQRSLTCSYVSRILSTIMALLWLYSGIILTTTTTYYQSPWIHGWNR